MPLPNGGGGFQVGSGNRAEAILTYTPTPATATATATLTATQIISGLLVANPSTTAATYTLPTAAQIDAAVPNAVAGNVFELNIVNLGTSTGTVTLATATGLTDGGNAFTAIPVLSSAQFMFRKTADGAWTVYKSA